MQKHPVVQLDYVVNLGKTLCHNTQQQLIQPNNNNNNNNNNILKNKTKQKIIW